MKGIQVTKHNLPQFIEDIQDELDITPVLIVSCQSGDTGKWGMARLWRAWMETTAKFMAANGCTMPLMIKTDGSEYGKRPFNSSDAHELFTSQWLCIDSGGERLSWSKNGRDGMRSATKGERFNALRKHECWAVERGVMLFKPRSSEYCQIEKEQDGRKS